MMASAELQLTATPKGEDNVNNASSDAIASVKDALKALTLQSDSGKVSSDILQHTNVSRCAPISIGNTETQIISSDLEETVLSKSKQENASYANLYQSIEVSAKAEEKENTSITRENVKQYPLAGEKEDSDINECQVLYTNSKFEETENQTSNFMKAANTEKELLKEELKLLQCPFTWNLNFKNIRTTTERVIANCNDKLNVLEEEEKDDDDYEEFEWRRFILTLILCHEHYASGSYSEALAKLEECENLITKCQSHEKPDIFFRNIKEALMHVVNASKCHLLVSLNRFSDAVKLKHGISRYEDMDRQNMAAVFGIQASMLMEYGYEGTKAALECAEKAVKLDGNEAEWHFLYGKLLGRIRRVENFTEIPTQEELSALEQAVRTTKNAARIVFLAQAYREAASKAFGKNRNNLDTLKDILNKMNEKSLQLYWEALKLNGNSARVNIRCAAGLLKLPMPYRDLKKAEECIEKALKIVPNNAMANHVAGNLYERLSKFELAEKFYRKSGELGAYGAYMNLLTMKFKRDKKYDPLSELEEMLQQFTEDARIQETYLQMGSYHFYFKNDIFTALDYWMKAIEKDPNAEKLKAHICSFLDMKTPVNLYQVITDEVRLALEQTTLTDENVLKLRKMLLYCTERYPELLSNKPQSWREHSLKERNAQGRRKNQNNGKEGGQWHRNKRQEQWRSEARKEDRGRYGRSNRSSRDNFSAGRSHDSQLQQHENWRYSHRNASFSDEVGDTVQKHASTSNAENASNSTEKDNDENLGSKINWNQQLSGTYEGFRIGEKWQTDAQEKHRWQRNHSRGSWRNKDCHSSSQQHVRPKETRHSRKNEENKYSKCEASEKN